SKTVDRLLSELVDILVVDCGLLVGRLVHNQWSIPNGEVVIDQVVDQSMQKSVDLFGNHHSFFRLLLVLVVVVLALLLGRIIWPVVDRIKLKEHRTSLSPDGKEGQVDLPRKWSHSSPYGDCDH